MALYILLISAVRATRCMRNLNKTSRREECTVGPTSKVSFRETPVGDLADASKNRSYLSGRARSFVHNMHG